MKKVLLVIAMALASLGVSAAEWTNSQPIAWIEYDGSTDTLWVKGSAVWSATNCTTTWVRVADTVVGRKQILAIVQGAKLSSASIQFSGDCSSDPTVFNANYVKAL